MYVIAVVYWARPSYGWLSTLILFFVSIFLVYVSFHFKKNPVGRLITGVIGCALIVSSLLFLAWFPTVRYEFSGKYLYLKTGWLASRITLVKIKEIERKNLKYYPASTGWQVPGYALFNIYYADEGWVRMYSHAVLRDIIIIKTKKKKFGITPKAPEKFMNDLRTRIKRRHNP